MTFIDEHCHFFLDQEENLLEYTDIHALFKDMIDALLWSFCDELGISEEVFVKAVY
jgi:hypothetical protein